jgi:hypothetical protein
MQPIHVNHRGVIGNIEVIKKILGRFKVIQGFG